MYVDVGKAEEIHCTNCGESYSVVEVVVVVAVWRTILDWIQTHPDWNKPDRKDKPNARG